MIEIKSRWDGRVLYRTEKAQDVRSAVTEAVAVGADLGGANLASANLVGANLVGANLRSANLAGASLGDADLRNADLRGASLGDADLRNADLRGASLGGANLRTANLAGANLGNADLRGASLRGTNLRGTNLRGTNLMDADLWGTKGLNKYLTTPLYMLLDQEGPIRAYKLVDENGRSPMQNMGKLTYLVGHVVKVTDASTDETQHCAAGINVASLDWCIKEWRPGWRILVVEFSRDDIACIPLGSDGKFRLHRCTVVGEKDLAEIGLAGD